MPTEDLASLFFGLGLPAAEDLRTRLLDALDAEPERLTSARSDDDVAGIVPVVQWISGPCATSFIVRPTMPETPGLGVLEVMTVLGAVVDLDAARMNVELLNLHTHLGRWSVLGDPGPGGWMPVGGELVDSQTRELMSTLVHATPELAPHVVCSASFVVGDADIELPFAAIELTVREQIATVTALMSSGLPDAWGEPLLGRMPDGSDRAGPDDWHEIVHHFEHRVLPHADVDPSPLMDAMIDAFNAHVSLQTSVGDAFWTGAADESGFRCEVPYGPGPYAGGAVWAANPGREPDDAPGATSLVEAFVASNPHTGNGLLVTMHVPHTPPPEHRTAGWTAALLNEQASLTAPGGTRGVAHAVGAWVEHDGQISHRCFVPAAWLVDPAGPDPEHVFSVLLANLARLSWAARRVLEFDPDLVETIVSGRHGSGGGLTAGSRARGEAFGEPGSGIDPGARLLAAAFRHTVGNDTEWARLDDDRRGFVWSPNAFEQFFESQPCSCVDRQGALLTISTPLGPPHADEIDALAAAGAEGHPFAVCLTPHHTVELRSKLHVHGDTLSWLWSWPTAISVAQAITAERLQDRVSSVRPERDQILEIFDLPNFASPAPELAGPRALALAILQNAHVPLGARWDDGAAIVTWATDGSALPDAVTTGRLASTRLERRAAVAYGPGLEMRTRFSFPNDQDPAMWVLHANQALIDDFEGTVLGGLTVSDGLAYCSFVPLGLEHDADSDGAGALSGTLLAHHTAVVESLSRRTGLRLAPAPSHVSLESFLEALIAQTHVGPERPGR